MNNSNHLLSEDAHENDDHNENSSEDSFASCSSSQQEARKKYPLHEACFDGDLERVNHLLSANYDPIAYGDLRISNHKDYSISPDRGTHTPLFYATLSDNPLIVRRLFEISAVREQMRKELAHAKKIELDYQQNQIQYLSPILPITWAVTIKSIAMLDEFLRVPHDYKDTPNVFPTIDYQNNLLSYAALDIACFERLIKIPYFRNQVHYNHNAAARAAAREGKLDTLKIIMEFPEVRKKLKKDYHERMQLIKKDPDSSRAECGAYRTHFGLYDRSLLTVAIEHGHAPIVEHLLTIPEILKIISAFNNEALHAAAKTNQPHFISLLSTYPAVIKQLENDAAVRIANPILDNDTETNAIYPLYLPYGNPLLFLAASNRCPQLLKMTLALPGIASLAGACTWTSNALLVVCQGENGNDVLESLNLLLSCPIVVDNLAANHNAALYALAFFGLDQNDTNINEHHIAAIQRLLSFNTVLGKVIECVLAQKANNNNFISKDITEEEMSDITEEEMRDIAEEKINALKLYKALHLYKRIQNEDNLLLQWAQKEQNHTLVDAIQELQKIENIEQSELKKQEKIKLALEMERNDEKEREERDRDIDESTAEGTFYWLANKLTTFLSFQETDTENMSNNSNSMSLTPTVLSQYTDTKTNEETFSEKNRRTAKTVHDATALWVKGFP